MTSARLALAALLAGVLAFHAAALTAPRPEAGASLMRAAAWCLSAGPVAPEGGPQAADRDACWLVSLAAAAPPRAPGPAMRVARAPQAAVDTAGARPATPLSFRSRAPPAPV